MNKKWKIGTIVVVAVALFVGAGTFAMAQTAPEGTAPGACGGGLGMRGFGGNAAVLTDLLGLTADELYQLRADGKTLAQIAASKGITEDVLVAAILEQREEVLQAAVTAGRLTQEQADLMLQNMAVNIRLQITSTAGPKGCGVVGDETAPAAGFGGVRGFGGMMGWQR